MKIVVAAVAVTAVAAAWGGFDWWQAAHDDGVARASFRDSALQDGRSAIAGLTTVDYRKADTEYQHWLTLSGGRLHDDLAKGQKDNLARIAQSKTVTTGTVTDAAVTRVDTGGGTVELIASVELSVTPDGAEAVLKHNRYQAELARCADGWQVTGLGQLPVEGTR